MSEGLQSKYLKNGKVVGQFIAGYEYFNIGDVTFKQLVQAKIVPHVFHTEYSSKKPDRLVVNRSDKNDPTVIAVIEDKQSGRFASEIERTKAIRQCNNYAQELGAKVGVITDGIETIWINPHEPNKDTGYIDETTGATRSYSLVRKEDGSEINAPFDITEKDDIPDLEEASDQTIKTIQLLKELSVKINEKNSIIREPGRIDPLPLAKRVWQDIWIATGKSPEKCLYNVVELFIFKFLSDLGILKDPHDFSSLYRLLENNNKPDEILTYYVNTCRSEIYKKFPKGSDGTTIINGTIFVDEHGDANITQAILFKETIKKFKDFEGEYGKFSTHNIDKDFKTKLYESFLKQTAGLKALGQFFTPRRVVRAVVEMSGVSELRDGQSLCDPFCGVGGFVLEPLNLPERSKDFSPRRGKIDSPITYRGYDKGFEKDEERTIILAKANMLIYLAEQVAENTTVPTEEFAKNAFNKTFTLIRSNLGTLGKISLDESEKFDLVLTNPPYVKAGIKTLKNEIEEDSDLKNFYKINGGGLEGLALEWIIRHLKKNGSAFIITPDGILHRNEDKKLRKFIQDECFIDAIVSLPQKTFYATPKKTYILAITKKASGEERQKHPVFTYLVSNIGETLDINRFETPERNDLKEMVLLYKQFKSIKKDSAVSATLEAQSPRCKIQPIVDFDPARNWLIDRWWTKEEKIQLGIEESEELISADEFEDRMTDAKDFLVDQIEKIQTEELAIKTKREFQEIELDAIVDLERGDASYTSRYVNEHPGSYPLYTAKTEEEGLMGCIDTFMFDEECLTYTTNGVHAGTVFHRNKHKFSLNGDAALMRIKSEFKDQLDYDYLYFAVQDAFKTEGLGWEYKATKGKVQRIKIRVPVDRDQKFDLEAQEEIANAHRRLERLKEEVEDKLKLITESRVLLDS